MKLGSCDNLIPEGISYACINIKVYCKDCEWNDGIYCRVIGNLGKSYDNKNIKVCCSRFISNGECQYYKPKTNFINKIIKKLWK